MELCKAESVSLELGLTPPPTTLQPDEWGDRIWRPRAFVARATSGRRPISANYDRLLRVKIDRSEAGAGVGVESRAGSEAGSGAVAKLPTALLAT